MTLTGSAPAFSVTTETTEEATPRTLVKKLAAIMKSVGRVPKRGFNDHFKYKFATEVDVTAALQQRLADANIMVLPEVVEVTKDGKLTTVKMLFTFHDGDSGEELALRWAGYGEDSSDKGIWKAITGALKYFLLKAFLVPTGDDPEAAEPKTRKAATPVPERTTDTRVITPEHVTRLKALMKQHNTDERQFGRALRDKFGWNKWSDIPRDRYDHVCRVVTEGGSLDDPNA